MSALPVALRRGRRRRRHGGEVRATDPGRRQPHRSVGRAGGRRAGRGGVRPFAVPATDENAWHGRLLDRLGRDFLASGGAPGDVDRGPGQGLRSHRPGPVDGGGPCSSSPACRPKAGSWWGPTRTSALWLPRTHLWWIRLASCIVTPCALTPARSCSGRCGPPCCGGAGSTPWALRSDGSYAGAQHEGPGGQRQHQRAHDRDDRRRRSPGRVARDRDRST